MRLEVYHLISSMIVFSGGFIASFWLFLLSPSLSALNSFLALFCIAVGPMQLYSLINGIHSVQWRVPHYPMVSLMPALPTNRMWTLVPSSVRRNCFARVAECIGYAHYFQNIYLHKLQFFTGVVLSQRCVSCSANKNKTILPKNHSFFGRMWFCCKTQLAQAPFL